MSEYPYRERWPRPVYFVFRVLRVAAVASSFMWFWGFAFVLAWTLLPVVALFSRDSRKSCQRIVRFAFRVFHGYMKLFRLVDLRLVNEPPPASGPVVFVANHATLVDVTAICCKLPKVCAIAGARFTSSPLVGRLLNLYGFIPDGTSVESSARVLDVAQQRLADGYHVLLFPEGTRSPPGELRRFHRGAFELACRAKVPVVPLVIDCRPNALRKDMRFWQHPDKVAVMTIEVDPPLDPAEFGFTSRPLRDAVEARFRSRLGLPPADRTSRRERAEHGLELESGTR